MADHLKPLPLIILALALTACAHGYDQPYKLVHGTGTWEKAQSCPLEGQPCACYREPSEKLCHDDFCTDLHKDPCSKDALQLERAYYPSLIKGTAYGSGDTALPLLGVALSGGGARSASTSIGFLSGLDHKGILAQVDLISSVSGGSYASYWFYSHLYNEMYAPDDERWLGRRDAGNEDRYSTLFDDVDRFQRQVAKNSRLASKSQGPVTSRLEMAAEVLTWLPTIPFHWLTAGLFDRKDNLNPLTHYYHAGLERAYGLYPTGNADPPTAFTNASALRFLNTPVPFVPRFEANDPSLKEIRNFHDAQRQEPALMPPFWIVNATAVYGGKAKMFREVSWGGFSHDLRDTVYEFTPIHYGSSRLGYCDYPPEREADHGVQSEAYPGCNAVNPLFLKYGRIVGASGAAVDGINPTVNVLLDVFNGAIGRYIDNPRVDDSVRHVHQWLPFPFYGLHRATHDEAAPRIYLTDGGHAENLGMYALIKRKAKNIIVLDAEQEYRSEGRLDAAFEALQELRCRLYAEHRLHLMIVGQGKDPYPGPFFDNPTPCNTTLARANIKFPVQNKAFPYLEGWICLSGDLDCADDANRLNIFYVKLAIGKEVARFNSDDPLTWDEQCLTEKRYQCQVRKYYHEHQDIFPHDGTQDIFYSEEQYSAYRDLGFDLAKCIAFVDGKVSRDRNQAGCEDLP